MSHHEHHGHHDSSSSRHSSNDEELPWQAPEPIPRGAGAGRILFFDAFSGVAGDMTAAAMLDLGVPKSVFDGAVAALGLPGVSLKVVSVRAGAIGATRFDVLVAQPQPARSYAAIRELLDEADLSSPVVELAQAMFLRLGQAESTVHRVALEKVHFHEVGSVDAIVDIVCAASGIEFLGASVECAPLPMGAGLVQTQHGPVPLPAPATLECLKGVPTRSAGIEGELVTPTGATIVATAARCFRPWPPMVPVRIGWGAGTKRWPDRPNVLRVVLGERHAIDGTDGYELIEANVDDMSGELAAHAMEAIREAGAVDVWATTLLMKKGRPGLMLSALVVRGDADAMVSVVFRETTTIGVRVRKVRREERPRRMVKVHTRYGDIPVKVSEGAWGPAQMKPEFDAAARAAKANEVPVRVVLDEVRSAYLRLDALKD